MALAVVLAGTAGEENGCVLLLNIHSEISKSSSVLLLLLVVEVEVVFALVAPAAPALETSSAVVDTFKKS